MSRFAGAAVIIGVTAGLAACGSGEDKRTTSIPAAEAAADLRGQEVPGTGTVKRARCVDPPLRCAVLSKEGRAASCEVAVASDGERGFYCKRAHPVSKAVVGKPCSDWAEQAGIDSDGDFACATATVLDKLPPKSRDP
jgi:hypothetical protein